MLELLLPHIRINSIADYYNIVELKYQASARIRQLLRSSWSIEGFSSAVDEVFSLTSDTNVHEIMVGTATDHLEELIGRQDFIQMGMVNKFTIGMIQQMYAIKKAHEKEISDLILQRDNSNATIYSENDCNACGMRMTIVAGCSHDYDFQDGDRYILMHCKNCYDSFWGNEESL